MKREIIDKAIDVLSELWDGKPKAWADFYNVVDYQTVKTTLDALRAIPQPDPITGLVPCGCGCSPELRADDWGWYQVYCTGCDMHGGNSHTPDNVIEEWNTSMGYKGAYHRQLRRGQTGS